MKMTGKRLLQGYLIGAANIIPGVSGGTLALVLGIYPRLLAALANADWEALRSFVQLLTLRSGGATAFRRTLRRLDAGFLALLCAGALVAVFTLSRLLTFLLHNYLTATYSFFFGLILMSVIFPFRLLRRRGARETFVCLAAAAVTVTLTMRLDEERAMVRAEQKIVAVNAAQGMAAGATATGNRLRIALRLPESGKAARFFAAAALAMAAMLLPGVSGSFVLLLLGVYFEILQAVNERDLLLLGVFMAGGGFGLLALARIVNICLRRWFDFTMAVMIGLMLGSLVGLWPFKRYMIIAGEIFFLGNRFPAQVSETLMAAAVCAAAVTVVLVIARLETGKPGAVNRHIAQLPDGDKLLHDFIEKQRRIGKNR